MYEFLLLLSVFALPALANAVKQFKTEREINSIEKTLPDALLAFCNSTNFETGLHNAASLKTPASILFKKTLGLSQKGAPMSIALSRTFVHSFTIQKTGNLLAKVYTNGNSDIQTAKQFALELSDSNNDREQIEADASLQKYSLLLCCALLVPLVIAFIYSISTKASVFLQPNAMVSLPIITLSINIYLILLAVISSYFLSKQFSAHFLTFFSITAPVSLLVFNIAPFFLT